MNLSEEWRSLWPISSIFSAPRLLVDHSKSAADSRRAASEEKNNVILNVGPLMFNPCPNSLTHLLSSPSLSPRILSPFPESTAETFVVSSSSLLPSTASTLDLGFDYGLSQVSACPQMFNCLQLLPWPTGTGNSHIAVFVPAGENYDRVGFSVLCLKDSRLIATRCKEAEAFAVSDIVLNHRISQLLVNPVANPDYFKFFSRFSLPVIAFLIARTMYSVHWFAVSMAKESGDVVLEYVGHSDRSTFRSSATVHACWNPHLCEQCVVLLDNGEMFLFDLGLCSKKWISVATNVIEAEQLRVSWNNLKNGCGDGEWVSCEFSWHPKILLVAHSTAVYLVDFRSNCKKVSCLLKIEMLSGEKLDRVVALSTADSSGFLFAVASRRLLILGDVRKPWMPLLRWLHGLANPQYVSVIRLSNLRVTAKDDKYEWATNAGYCILLASFWDCEFMSFCYGPGYKVGPPSSKMLKLCNSFYAWGLPSEVSISGCDCKCGNCLTKEDFERSSLLNWIDWRQKKKIVVGFGILDCNFSIQLSEDDELGGFSVVRLMSSGDLEAQRYSASWQFKKLCQEAQTETNYHLADNFLYDIREEEHDKPRKPPFLELDYLKGYLDDNLTEVLSEKLKKVEAQAYEDVSNFRTTICRILKERRVSPDIITKILKDFRLPTNDHQVDVHEN